MNFFSRKKSRDRDSASRRSSRRPHLDRRNAANKYDFDAASTSASSSSASSYYLDVSTSLSSGSGSLHTRSVNPAEPTSFRIHGDEGDQLEMILKRLGLSGIDDLSISTADWESSKIRSPASRLFSPGTEEEVDVDGGEGKAAAAELDQAERSPVHDVDGGGLTVANAAEMGSKELTEPTRCRHRLSPDEPIELPSTSAESTKSTQSFDFATVCSGPKGIRLPELKPPPSIRIPIIDNELSTWDLIRNLAPAFEPELGIIANRSADAATERKKMDEEEEEVYDRWLTCGHTAPMSSPCSFTTTSNDEDCSSTSTESKSNNISPNGKVRRVITSWEKSELLGRGSFGSVYEAMSHSDGSFFAVKEVSLLDQGPEGKQRILQLEQEIMLLSSFEHENIVQYYGTDKDESNLYIFIEYMTRGSLATLCRKYHLKDSQISAYTRQILHGLKYLHEQNVVHRDIKCANILVDANGYVKLADFGLAKATAVNDIKSCRGTAYWMAPEVVKANSHVGYGLSADIWSLGCTILEMFTREVPYHPLESMQAVFQIGKGKPPQVPDTITGDARDFILKCLQVNPRNRPTAAQLLAHPFVSRPLPSYSVGTDSPGPYYFIRR